MPPENRPDHRPKSKQELDQEARFGELPDLNGPEKLDLLGSTKRVSVGLATHIGRYFLSVTMGVLLVLAVLQTLTGFFTIIISLSDEYDDPLVIAILRLTLGGTGWFLLLRTRAVLLERGYIYRLLPAHWFNKKGKTDADEAKLPLKRRNDEDDL